MLSGTRWVTFKAGFGTGVGMATRTIRGSNGPVCARAAVDADAAATSRPTTASDENVRISDQRPARFITAGW
jgi:hypothetical protein